MLKLVSDLTLQWENEYQKRFACGFLHAFLEKVRFFGIKKLPIFTIVAERTSSG